MRLGLTFIATVCALSASVPSLAKPTRDEPKPWCAPEVRELSDHVCWFDGSSAGQAATQADGRRTLVIYMHGAYAATPGFQWLQQRALAMQAKRLGFTLLLPTAPRSEGGYVWPTSQAAQKREEQALLDGIRKSKAELERRAGRPFDETFVVGFSSGAYYASSVALRSALDVDGFIVLAGGSSWAKPESNSGRRAPVFVGVSASDKATADHSRAFAGTLAVLGWPRKVEERDVGHYVDPTFLAHGLSWLRGRAPSLASGSASGSPSLRATSLRK